MRDLKRSRAACALVLVTIVSLLMSGLTAFAGGANDQTKKAQALAQEKRIQHVLNRLGFGARPGDLERVKAMGLEKYINQQLNPETISDELAEAKVKTLSTLTMTTAELYEKFPQPGQLLQQLQRRGELPGNLAEARENRVKGGANAPANNQEMPKAGDAVENGDANKMPGDAAKNNPGAPQNPLDNEKYRAAIRDYYVKNGLQPPQRIMAELQASRILRAVYSERQLQEVMVDFWTNHFNVFAGKGADRWLLISYDRDTIRPNAMGKFSDLLLATAKSPAMLFYLDNFQSVSPNAQLGPQQRPGLNLSNLRMSNNPQQQRPQQQARRGINENYARELMELHTLGVDGGYTQKDVQEVARCFTGWTIFAPRGGGAAAQAIMNGPRADMLRENAGKFFFNPRAHDDGEKIVLGHKIPAGGGIKDGLTVLDILAHQPATAKFVATKLVRRFVSDSPPPALVDRVAATFTRTDGDIKETLKAIFFSPEFNSAENYRAKVKRPFELAISAIRALGAETTGGPQVHQWIARMGEPLYGFQTPNGYSDLAENWVNTGALLERLNFGLALASNRIPGTRVNLSQFIGQQPGTESIDKAKVMDHFLSIIVAGDITPRTRETLLKQLDGEITFTISPPPAPPQRTADQELAQMMIPPGQRQQQAGRPGQQASITDPVTKIVGLILGSPEFQRQ